MKKNKSKVLVLLDLKANTDEIVNYTVKLAKLVDADFEFFSVKKPTEVVNTDSQLSAIRAINRDRVDTNNEIKNIVKLFDESLGTNAKTTFAIGNIKTEIENRLNGLKPDIVVLGKRKSKTFNLMGDKITNVLSQKNDIKVLIASKKTTAELLNDLPSSFVSQKHRELAI